MRRSYSLPSSPLIIAAAAKGSRPQAMSTVEEAMTEVFVKGVLPVASKLADPHHPLRKAAATEKTNNTPPKSDSAVTPKTVGSRNSSECDDGILELVKREGVVNANLEEKVDHDDCKGESDAQKGQMMTASPRPPNHAAAQDNKEKASMALTTTTGKATKAAQLASTAMTVFSNGNWSSQLQEKSPALINYMKANGLPENVANDMLALASTREKPAPAAAAAAAAAAPLPLSTPENQQLVVRQPAEVHAELPTGKGATPPKNDENSDVRNTQRKCCCCLCFWFCWTTTTTTTSTTTN